MYQQIARLMQNQLSNLSVSEKVDLKNSQKTPQNEKTAVQRHG